MGLRIIIIILVLACPQQLHPWHYNIKPPRAPPSVPPISRISRWPIEDEEAGLATSTRATHHLYASSSSWTSSVLPRDHIHMAIWRICPPRPTATWHVVCVCGVPARASFERWEPGVLTHMFNQVGSSIGGHVPPLSPLLPCCRGARLGRQASNRFYLQVTGIQTTNYKVQIYTNNN